MWASVFVVFLAVGGSLASGFFGDCDTSKCNSPMSSLGIKKTAAPTEEQLKAKCPGMLERYVCENKVIKGCYGKDLEELTSSDNHTVASFTRLLLNWQRVFTDLCDEDSLLHEGYVASVDCFNDILQEHQLKCYQEAMTVYEAFMESQKLLGVVKDDEEEAHDDADCFITTYVVACFSVELKEQCGEIARATMVEILKRVQYLSNGVGACSPDQITFLRTTYLEFMELEEQKKDWFSQVFNTKK